MLALKMESHVQGPQGSLWELKPTLNQQSAIIKSRMRVVDYTRRLRHFSETSLLSALILLLEWHPVATTKPSDRQHLVICESQDADFNLYLRKS